MALTAVIGGYCLDLTLDGATDWLWTDVTFGWGAVGGIRLQAILWRPVAAGNIIQIRDGSLTGPVIFYAKAADDTDQRVIYFDNRVMNRPCIKASEQTGNTKISFLMRGVQK